MKISLKKAEYLLIKAMNTSECEDFGFAIIHITDEWKQIQMRRLEAVKTFENDYDLKWLNYADTSVEFFRFSKEHYPEVEEWLLERNQIFIELSKKDLRKLITHENRPHNYQMHIYKNGNAIYNAFGKYIDEEFWTKEFSLIQLTQQL